MKNALKRPCSRLAKPLALALQLFTIHYSLFTASAAVPVAWTNSPGMPPYPIKPVPHGSTVDLAVTLKGYTTPPIADGADVRLWYQTNGMGQAWWSAPATFDGNTIAATFGPEQDCGADRVSLFFGAPSNVFASAVLRLTHAPGFAPSSLPPPPGVAMQPWVAEQLTALAVAATNYTDSATNALGSVLRDTIAESTPGNYETVSNRAMRISLPDDDGHPGGVFSPYFNGLAKAATDASNLTKPGQSPYPGKLTLNQRYQEDGEGALTGVWWPAFLDAWNAWHWVASEDYVDEAINNIDIPDPSNYATKSELGDVAEEIEDVRAESALVYRLYSGSNVVAEVTNFNSAVHAPELRLMQLNESNEYITVWAETNGLARTLAAAKKHTDDATNELKNIYAPRAWSRTTSGLGADAPANTTWISTPRTVIAGGLEYAKIVDAYGEVWVLASNGMAADFNPDTNAYFRITADDGTPVFSIEKSDAQVVGAYAEGITASANSVTMPVPVVSSTAPTMYWRHQLDSDDWSDQTTPPAGATVTWTGSAGSWVCTVTFGGARPPSMFFKFSFLQEGGVVIRNNATTDLSSGIWVNGTKFVPTVSGNNLIWTKQ